LLACGSIWAAFAQFSRLGLDFGRLWFNLARKYKKHELFGQFTRKNVKNTSIFDVSLDNMSKTRAFSTARLNKARKRECFLLFCRKRCKNACVLLAFSLFLVEVAHSVGLACFCWPLAHFWLLLVDFARLGLIWAACGSFFVVFACFGRF
jgi:hypothetical protein